MNKQSHSESYKNAGVDITAGYKAVELMKAHIARTTTAGVLGGVGGFGGAFALPKGLEEPVLVSGTDGVGTKLKIAFMLDKHDTVGIDCVAMCVNDIICTGARPLFFLDYIATGKTVPEKIEQIVAGVAEGCVQAGAALVGGETAEMPGFYQGGEYDIAGFSVGVVERAKMLGARDVQAGDVLIALPSSGLHSNGFSLVRKVFTMDAGELAQYHECLGTTLGQALLTPTKIYVKPVLALLEAVAVHGISHITGGGLYENIPRMLPEGITARIEKAAIKTPPIFTLLQEKGNIPQRDMFNTYNMGVGMCVAVPPQDAQKALETLRAAGEDAYIIGAACEGEGGVELW
ncbi:phosphoribosylformylglycinamidine cyclo-ligase [Ruminococcaceae bacterium OttesenSCG-928-N02]|nr:phosphoribosylformylglycinamidine cyclo-ligase [Ruminococcaceae bacterium OttesenSCG-928-N02]